MKVSTLINEEYNTGIEVHKIALEIYRLAESTWEDENGQYPTPEQTMESLKNILSQLHNELTDVIEAYK